MQGYQFQVSAITVYKVYSDATTAQLPFGNDLLEKINSLPFDKDVVKQAVITNRQLKQKRKQIDLADLFIAATVIENNLPFATLNRKHFERIDSLDIVKQGERPTLVYTPQPHHSIINHYFAIVVNWNGRFSVAATS